MTDTSGAGRPRVLHLLSQRPEQTGSGVTLDALVRHAAAAGWPQDVVVGVPDGQPVPAVGGLPTERIHPLFFGGAEVPFPVPGMSDVMPYASTRFSSMDAAALAVYRAAWRRHVGAVLEATRPALVHVHHVWLLAALVKDVAPGLPVVDHCHATGLRQMGLCPHLAEEVRRGCARNERFLVTQPVDRAAVIAALDVAPERVTAIGAGYRDELFHARGRVANPGPRLLYVGKYAAAKGLPWLLEAVERLAPRVPGLVLEVAGSGAGPEAEALADRMRAMAPLVRLHGQLPQPALAALMRQSAALVLPSFYEGLPLVLVEALACGCRLVATALPGIEHELAPRLGPALRRVPLPRLLGADVPEPAELPAFVEALVEALARTLAAPPLVAPDPEALGPFTWDAVFRRVEAVWQALLAAP